MEAALAAVLAVIAAVAVGCGGSHARVARVVKGAPPPPSRSELRTLTRLALSAAGGAGDPHPTDGVLVASTRKIAERVDAGAVVDSNPPVYFVVLHGHFTGNMAPAGGRFPKGTVLTLTIDPRTNEALDTGIGRRVPNLDAIGKAQPLPLTRDVSARVRPVGRVQAAIRAARKTDPLLFAIFPRVPGKRACALPTGGMTQQALLATCRTRVSYPNTHGHGEVRVEFRESWGSGRFSSWTMWEELPTMKVLVTKLHGKPAPQLRYAATDGVRRTIRRADAVRRLRRMLGARPDRVRLVFADERTTDVVLEWTAYAPDARIRVEGGPAGVTVSPYYHGPAEAWIGAAGRPIGVSSVRRRRRGHYAVPGRSYGIPLTLVRKLRQENLPIRLVPLRIHPAVSRKRALELLRSRHLQPQRIWLVVSRRHLAWLAAVRKDRYAALDARSGKLVALMGAAGRA